MTLFRIVEIEGGSISVDGFDITQVPLETLRSNLAIIPQDPILFTGNIRFQLDPFSRYSTDDIWDVLDKVNMTSAIRSMPDGLNAVVLENGENLSQGQRQLLCIARALLRRARILIMDEATSAVDPYTDDLIQQVLKEDAAINGTTVLTIAHRLQTIADFDRILVLADGKVAEFDRPQVLLADPNSIFSAMMNESSH